MGLMTEAYWQLQKQLHAQGNYGKGTDAQECADLVRSLAGPLIDNDDEQRPLTILDYGCGNGHLKPLLAEYDVREYDPCIEGKEGRPEPADCVVCADVLEHVEPDCLDTVLAHLNEVANGRLIAIIATRPSQKVLADGRNAHLIVESPEWWKRQISRFFRIDKYEDRHEAGRGVLIIAEPVRSLENLIAFGVMSDDKRNEQTAKNVGLTWRRLPQSPIPAHKNVAIICCYGPSLGHTIKHIPQAIKDIEAEGAKAFVVSVSGAHDFLRKKGIRPDFHTECDPRPHKSKMIKRIGRKTKYLMASCCDPDFLKRIADTGYENLVLWHLFNGPESYKIRDIPGEEKETLIPGGGSIALRTMVLFYFLGFRDFYVHGFDCSFSDDGETHAGPHSGKELKRCKVRIGDTGRWYETAPVMATYANHMMSDLKHGRFPNCRFTFAGQGLFQDMLKDYLAQPKMPPPENFGVDYFSMTEKNRLPNELWGDALKEAS